MYSLAKKLTSEFIGTALLLATVVGSGIMAEQLSDGNVAIALFGNTIPTGAILFVLITVFGPVSGAHFNPAVTLVFMLKGDLPAFHAALYVVVQIVAGVFGVLIAHLMFEQVLVQIASTIRTGQSQWFSEAIATFGLVMTILGTVAVRERAVATAVGLYITAAYWFTASTSFANPAVTIARGFTDTFAGIRPLDVPWFIAAQLVAAVVAWLICSWLFQSDHTSTEFHND